MICSPRVLASSYLGRDGQCRHEIGAGVVGEERSGRGGADDARLFLGDDGAAIQTAAGLNERPNGRRMGRETNKNGVEK